MTTNDYQSAENAPERTEPMPKESIQEGALQETEELRQQNGELITQIQRLQAEFINYRNRIDREAEANKNAASEKLLHEILTVADSLQLAIQHAKGSDGQIKGEDLLSGIVMINEQMAQLLEHQGLQEIAAHGKFDPRLHEALMSVPQEGSEKGTILQTFQRGYMLNEKPFRPAKVSVAK